MNRIVTPINKAVSDQFPVKHLQFVPGIWINGKYHWLNNSMEKVIFEEELSIKVKQEQIHSKIRFFSIYISNHGHQSKELKALAMHHFFNRNQDGLTFLSPNEQGIFHLSDQEMHLINAVSKGERPNENTTMSIWNAYTDQIWQSLSKGILKYQPLTKGSAVSVTAAKMTIESKKTDKFNAWIITGSTKGELLSIEKALLKNPLAFPNEK